MSISHKPRSGAGPASRPTSSSSRSQARAYAAFGSTSGPDVGQRHRQHRLANVVEQEHPVVERERKVGNAPIVRGHVGKLLGVSNRVVGRKAHRPAHEPRQALRAAPCDNARRALRDRETDRPTGTAAARQPSSAVLDHRLLAAGLEPQERLGPQEAEPADLLTADDALEQKGEPAAVDQPKRRHRRQPIARQLTAAPECTGAEPTNG